MSNPFYSRYIPPKTASHNVPRHSSSSERPSKRVETAKPASTKDLDVENSQHRKLRLKYEKSRKPAEVEVRQEGVKLRAKEDENEVKDSEQHGLVPIPQPAPAADAPKASIASALPEWIRCAEYISAARIIELPDVSISLTTSEALKQSGYQRFFPIQAALFDYLLPRSPALYDGDICVSAATGSGKTLAYALPMVENLRGMPARKLRGLVVVPTRELVVQSKEVLDICARDSELKVGTAAGYRSLKEERDLLVQKGQRYDIQAYMKGKSKAVDELEDLMNWDFEALKEIASEGPLLPGWVEDYTSRVDILICTPGRLVEHINSTKGFDLHSVQWMIIDEADRLLDESFQRWVDIVMPQLVYLPALEARAQDLHRAFRITRRREVRKILLSATMTRDVSQLTALKLRKPKLVILDTGHPLVKPDGEKTAAHHREYNLPQTLNELAINVDDSSIKPIYLLEILRNGVKPPGPSHNESEKHDALLINGSGTNNPPLSASRTKDTTSPPNSTASDLSSSSDSDTRASHNFVATRVTLHLTTRGTLVFTSSTSTTTRLAYIISKLAPDLSAHVHAFTKYTSKKDRKNALSSFSKPEISQLDRLLPIIITTDLLSHGIDIPSLHQVINYSVPSSVKDYVHRVGRTARADFPGTGITLLENQQARWFWNEIARSPSIGRNQKVTRGTVDLTPWDQEKREDYQEALAQLGQAAVGEGES